MREDVKDFFFSISHSSRSIAGSGFANFVQNCRRERERREADTRTEITERGEGKSGERRVENLCVRERESLRRWKNRDGRGDNERCWLSAIADEAPGRSELYETVAN